MRLYFQYLSSGFSNCYLLGTDSGEAIIVDPGMVDTNLVRTIEDNSYTIKGVLVTHDHSHHVKGLNTLMRIYETSIYAINPVVNDNPCSLVRDGDIISIGPFLTEVISIPGHSADSAVYKIDRLLFTGDSLTAGLMGNTASLYAAATQVNAIRTKLFSLPGDFTILPGHGPPSSLEAERRFNMEIATFDMQKIRSPVFKIDN